MLLYTLSHSIYIHLSLSPYLHTCTNQIQDQLLAPVHMVVCVLVEGNDYALEARTLLVLILCRNMNYNPATVATVFSHLTL